MDNYLIKYLKYFINHKKEVFILCKDFGITWQGITHDLSKLSLKELLPSAKYYYSEKSTNTIKEYNKKEDYKAAWLHHKGHNPHHPAFWIDINDNGIPVANRMPLKYVYEMVADIVASGKEFSKRRNIEWSAQESYEYYKAHLRNSKLENFVPLEFVTRAVLDTIFVDIIKYGLDIVADAIDCGAYERYYEVITLANGEITLNTSWLAEYNNLVLEYYKEENNESKS